MKNVRAWTGAMIMLGMLLLAGCGTAATAGHITKSTPVSPAAVVSSIVAAEPASPAAASTVSDCRTRQLGLTYVGGQPGAGTDFGAIMIWDKGAQPCLLRGPLRITGLDRHAQPVTKPVSAQVPAKALLTAHGSGVFGGNFRLKAGQIAAFVPMAAEYRDDGAAPNGLCISHQVEPATWRVRPASGPAITVGNADRGEPGTPLTADRGLLTCLGRIGTAGPVTVGNSPG